MTKPTTHSRMARWGLLLVSLLTGAALLGTSVSSYLATRNAVAAISRARALDLLFSIRQTLVTSPSPDQELLTDLLESLEPQGVRFIGLRDDSGQMLVQAGQAQTDDWPNPPGFDRSAPRIDSVLGGTRILVIDRLVPSRARMGRGMGRGMRRGMGRMGWPGVQAGESRPWFRHGLVVEIEPVLANALASRATMHLMLSLVAATLLAGAAFVFLRLSRRAEQMAIQVERDRRLAALGQMSAILGHELRNPLASLKGHAQLLLEKLPADHAARTKATIVVDEAIRLERLTSQVLDFARTGELHIAPVEPARLLQASVESFATGRIVLQPADGLPPWSMDEHRMQQVLVNLLDNALRASPDDSNVLLSTARDGEQLVIQVRDFGPGLSAEEQDRIFEPFYTGRTQGTGLGLALARRIVAGHGGSIQAANHPEGGAVFTVRLPAGSVAHPEKKDAVASGR